MPRRAQRVFVRDARNQVLDDGLALYFSAPNSYTGEDVVELQLHGSPVVLAQVVEACVEAGAHRAAPGEFSQRAFLNDKLDLVQAEAIADLIDAGSRQAARAARRSLEGAFSREVETLADMLTQIRIQVEAALDFPDEELDLLGDGQLRQALAALVSDTQALLKRAETGKVLTEGVKVAIAGRPNAGKSSLFNALVRRDAAIVTDIPGTTRDVLRETVHLAGVLVELSDTAGLRETIDAIEAEGVRRAQTELDQADLVFWVRDGSDPADETAPVTDGPVIEVINKIDRLDLPARREQQRVWLSARTGEGLDGLEAAFIECLGLERLEGSTFSARARHIECIRDSLRHLEQAHAQLVTGGAIELSAEELRQAADRLGEITGRLHSDELLGLIFSSFCIGK